jgi:IclR family pca regulon transcriptional regulator
VVQPALIELAHTLKEASAASVLDEADAICIAATSAGRNVSATLQPGIRVPAYCTANGRVLVAALPEVQAEAWLAQQSLRALTPHTITRPERLRAELQRTREQGYATVDQELELSVRTLSVPLINWRGETVAAMNLAVHASRMSIDDLVATGLPALRQAQARLKQLL